MRSRNRIIILSVACVLLGALGIVIRALLSPDALTPHEASFAGTYSLTEPGTSAPMTLITFLPDRTCLYIVNGQPLIGLETDWEIAQGELRMANHYRVMPFRNGPLLPGMRQTETVTWSLTPTSDPSIFTLSTSTGASVGTLTRTE